MGNIDLKSLSDADLLALEKSLAYDAMIYNIKQMSSKISINSVYGACGSAYFRYYDKRLAAAVSVTGQLAIRWAANIVNDYMNGMLKTEGVEYVVYIDTDSVVGDTMIRTSTGTFKIEDLYNIIPGVVEIRGKDNTIKHVTNQNIKTYSVNSDLNLEQKTINYIMKHKVKKKLYRISSNGKSITVTEDHSVIVVRSGEMKSISPGDLAATDKIITM